MGHTVTGKTIPAKKGTELHVLSGYGFSVDEAGNSYYSLLDGLIELKEDSVEIKKMLIMDEVSLTIGDVIFDGDVYVKGDVFSGMKIKTGGDLVIDGYVEKVNIDCGGSAIFRQGVNSSGEGTIKAAGDVIGRFFEATEVRAGGSIRANYSMNSTLYAEEDIRINGRQGSLVGGVASAETGIEVYELGNEEAVKTTVRLSKHEALLNKLEDINARLKTIYEELALLGSAYVEFQQKYPPEIRNMKSTYIKIEAAIYTKELQSNELIQAKNRLEKLMKETDKAEIIVKNILHDGVDIYIGDDKIISYKVKGVRIKKQNDDIAMFAL